jgi:DNA uptake protein ComE-like DNA-binding protein
MIARRTLLSLVLALSLAAMAAVPVSLAAGARLNPNSASANQLASTPGLTPQLIDAIHRQRPFATMVEFNDLVRQVLSEKDAEALYELLFIPVNLNSASRAEIGLIPGMSSRMVREFLEYRPYADMGEFDREIGKYVDDAEVARLRSYVTL